MVNQQYYTRERKSLFAGTPGYGTIARSPELTDNFIQTVLEPYCRYNAPLAAQAVYPNVYIFYFPDGFDCMVIGNGAYIRADYTGERSTYFFHTLTLSGDDARAVMRSKMPGIIDTGVFVDEYDISLGNTLPQIDVAGILTDSTPSYSFIHDFNLSGTFIKQMLYALLMTVKTNKKLYISIDADYSEHTAYAMEMMSCLLSFVPYTLRTRIGFMSYSDSPAGYKNINVMFVDKDRLKLTDRTIENDYIFICGDRENNMDTAEMDEYDDFLDYLLTAPDSSGDTAVYFGFAESLLANAKKDVVTQISTYCDIYRVFQFASGQAGAEQRPVEMLSILLRFARTSDDAELVSNTIRLIIARSSADKDLLAVLSRYYDASDIKCDIAIHIYKCLLSYTEHDPEYAETFIFGEHGELRQALSALITAYADTPLFKLYFRRALRNTTSMALINHISSALAINKDIVPADLEPFFADSIESELLQAGIEDIILFSEAAQEKLDERWNAYFYKTFVIEALADKLTALEINSGKTLNNAIKLIEEYSELRELPKARLIKNINAVFTQNYLRVIEIIEGNSMMHQLQRIVRDIIIHDKIQNFEILYLCAYEDGDIDCDEVRRLIKAISDETEQKRNSAGEATLLTLDFFSWFIENHPRQINTDAFRQSLTRFLSENARLLKKKDFSVLIKKKLKGFKRLDRILQDALSSQRSFSGDLPIFILSGIIFLAAVIPSAIVLDKLMLAANSVNILGITALAEVAVIIVLLYTARSTVTKRRRKASGNKASRRQHHR